MSQLCFFQDSEMANISLNPKNGEIVLENLSIYFINLDPKSVRNISSLILTNDELENIEIPAMRKVSFIKLRENHLTKIDFMGDLPSLVILDISTNGLQEVSLPKTPKLMKLDLSRNNIKKFDARNLDSLVVLDLSHNDLDEVYIPYLPSIKFVYLSHNNLKKVYIDPRNNLSMLNLSRNPKLGKLSKSWTKNDIPKVVENLNRDYNN